MAIFINFHHIPISIPPVARQTPPLPWRKGLEHRLLVRQRQVASRPFFEGKPWENPWMKRWLFDGTPLFTPSHVWSFLVYWSQNEWIQSAEKGLPPLSFWHGSCACCMAFNFTPWRNNHQIINCRCFRFSYFFAHTECLVLFSCVLVPFRSFWHFRCHSMAAPAPAWLSKRRWNS